MNKKEQLEAFLEKGMVLVALNARHDGVDVPDEFKNDCQLRLNLSYNFGLPIQLNNFCVLATLTFGGVPYACVIPYASIFLMVSHVDGKHTLFQESVPDILSTQMNEPPTGIKEVIAAGEIETTPVPTKDKKNSTKKKTKHSHLRLIKGGK